MKNRYQILSDEGREFAAGRLPMQSVNVDDEVELEVSASEEKAMVAAGWISERVEDKPKGGKG